MSSVRSAASAVEVQGYIYVLGGYAPSNANCSDRLDVVERLDPTTNTWEFVTSMLTPRSHAMCVKYSCLQGFRTLIQSAVHDPEELEVSEELSEELEVSEELSLTF
eukprot:TRINITY_DN6145_c0_g1_i10.p1 TRINITY_DN6145_c0_g1~~TRINITY_DN6145_c0_g1_i10.p1  ORF type:complete len:106 (+),score=8.37 TRINITY_DN6145_c0_g1_i10:183-500(+)